MPVHCSHIFSSCIHYFYNGEVYSAFVAEDYAHLVEMFPKNWIFAIQTTGNDTHTVVKDYFSIKSSTCEKYNTVQYVKNDIIILDDNDIIVDIGLFLHDVRRKNQVYYKVRSQRMLENNKFTAAVIRNQALHGQNSNFIISKKIENREKCRVFRERNQVRFRIDSVPHQYGCTKWAVRHIHYHNDLRNAVPLTREEILSMETETKQRISVNIRGSRGFRAIQNPWDRTPFQYNRENNVSNWKHQSKSKKQWAKKKWKFEKKPCPWDSISDWMYKPCS